MLGSRNVLERGWLIVGGAAWLGLGLSGCGGQEFKSNDAGGGTSANAGSETGAQNAGGSSSTTGGSDSGGDAAGGAPDAGGSSSSGGTASAVCECTAGHYCRDGSVDCFDCAELNRLHFGVPERMATLSDNGQGSHFPRVGTTNTDLVYRFDGVGLRYTSDASTSAGSTVKGTTPQDTGPLLLDQDVKGLVTMTLPDFNFVFDRVEEMTRRSLYFGKWSGGLTTFERAPSPYNGDASDYSAAIALRPTADGVARLYWMTDRGATTGMPVTLVTALLEANAPGAPVALKIGQATCDASDPDYTPWVTADGKTLLISHTRVDGNCRATGQGKDIYTALLQPATGLPTAAAVPMSDVNSPMNDVEPSFSADLCDLYFASDRDGKYALYRAHRR
jgi:hypothetical protein